MKRPSHSAVKAPILPCANKPALSPDCEFLKMSGVNPERYIAIRISRLEAQLRLTL